MKKVISVLMATVLTLSLLAACGSAAPASTPTAPAENGGSTPASNGATAPQEVMDVRFVLPKADSPEMEKVTKAVNDKLKADGVPLNFIPLSIPSNVYNDRINVMFAGQEEFELLHVMENSTPFTVYLNNEYIIPIEDLLEQYGPNIKKYLPNDSDWSGSKLNGHTYTIPNYWKDTTKTGSECGAMGFRGDVLDELGLKIPTTSEELFNTAKIMKEKWDQKDAFLWMQNPGDAPVRLLRDTPRYPFYVEYSNELVMYFQDGHIEPYLESEEFKTVANWMKRAYDANLIHPDVLTISNAERDKMVNDGISLGGNLDAYNNEARLKKNGKVPNYRYEIAFLNPSVAALDSMAALNTNAVSSTSPHPEAGIMFLDWLYSDQANMDLLVYGIENIHYTKNDKGQFEFTKKEDGLPLYDFKLWQVGQKDFMRVESTAHEKWEWFQKEPYENVEPSVAKGFVFDPTPVQSQFQAVVAELPATIYPIKMGIQDYDTYYPAAIAKLKSIGYDAVVAEYQKQFKVFYDANRK